MTGKRKKIEKPFQSTTKEPKRNRSVLRPNAARKEKERLKAFNEALKNLQKVIPVKLPPGRKLHKKQTLQVSKHCCVAVLLLFKHVQKTYHISAKKKKNDNKQIKQCTQNI